MSDSRKIKNFSDFSMLKPSHHKMFNCMVVTGEYKAGFFSRKNPFEIIIYYTPIKSTIMSIIPENIPESEIPFKKGDNISVTREWVIKNNYKIKMDKKRI